MKNLLLTVLCLLVLLGQVSATQMHASGTVVGNILAEPYLALLASILVLVLTMI
jgi:hypothetical protein